MTTDYKAWTVYILALAAIVAGAFFFWTPAQAQEAPVCETIEQVTEDFQNAANARGDQIAMAKSRVSEGTQKLAILFPHDNGLMLLFEGGCLRAYAQLPGFAIRKHVFADRSIEQIFGTGS